MDWKKFFSRKLALAVGIIGTLLLGGWVGVFAWDRVLDGIVTVLKYYVTAQAGVDFGAKAFEVFAKKKDDLKELKE